MSGALLDPKRQFEQVEAGVEPLGATCLSACGGGAAALALDS